MNAKTLSIFPISFCSRKNHGCDDTLKINVSCHFRNCAEINFQLVILVDVSPHADTYLLLQLIHGPSDVFIGLLLIFLDHGLLQVLLQLLVQLFRHTHKHTVIARYIATQKAQDSMTITDKFVITVDFATDEIYNTQDLIALLTIHVMDRCSNNRGTDEDEVGAKAEEFFFPFSRSVTENAR